LTLLSCFHSRWHWLGQFSLFFFFSCAPSNFLPSPHTSTCALFSFLPPPFLSPLSVHVSFCDFCRTLFFKAASSRSKIPPSSFLPILFFRYSGLNKYPIPSSPRASVLLFWLEISLMFYPKSSFFPNDDFSSEPFCCFRVPFSGATSIVSPRSTLCASLTITRLFCVHFLVFLASCFLSGIGSFRHLYP